MIVIGAQWYAAEGAAERRQRQSRAALTGLAGVLPVNLQFHDEPVAFEDTRLCAVLRRDSRTITGRRGARKPLVPDMVDALADVASEEGASWVALINADIEVTADAVRRIDEGTDLDAFAFSRLDVDPVTRVPAGVQIYGTDMVAVRVDWWRAERRRFRPYILGEACWDNVYTAILSCHGACEIVNDASPGILHEQHESGGFGLGPFAEYNGFLAALDAPYFSRWAAYVTRIADARRDGMEVDREALMREAFGAPVRWSARHALRQAKARVRFAARRLGSSNACV